jgi:hypothetical protein
MEFFVEYWYIILAVIALLAVAIVAAVRFFKKPSNEQLDTLKQWLLWAVIHAEQKFGDHMGQVQLRYVYDLFVSRFPWLAKVISFVKFCGLVDEALAKMKKLIQENEAAAEYVSIK